MESSLKGRTDRADEKVMDNLITNGRHRDDTPLRIASYEHAVRTMPICPRYEFLVQLLEIRFEVKCECLHIRSLPLPTREGAPCADHIQTKYV